MVWLCFSSVQLPHALLLHLLFLLQVLNLRISHFALKLPLENSALILSLLSYQLFFSTGHQATFASIPFQVGFIGLSDFSFHLSGAMVIMNEIGTFVLSVVAIGYVCADFYDPRTKVTPFAPTNNPLSQYRGEHAVVVHRLMCLCGSSLMSIFLRRHLMVWKIFAPRFMMAAIDASVTLIVAVVVQLIS